MYVVLSYIKSLKYANVWPLPSVHHSIRESTLRAHFLVASLALEAAVDDDNDEDNWVVVSHEGSNDGTTATTPQYYVREGSMIELLL